MVYDWLLKLQHKVFPTICRLCRAPGEPGLELCSACREDLPWLNHACRACAIPLPAESNITVCAHCQNIPSPLDECKAVFTYHPPVDGWIQRLKFEQDLAVAALLGRLLIEKVPSCRDGHSPTALPVPLHYKRLRERGYNQALELARPLVGKGYHLDPLCCRRHKATAAQSGLPAPSRKGNLRNAFEISRPVEGQSFLLIDDVMTTGATLNELARTLKKAGAARVEAWVICRTSK